MGRRRRRRGRRRAMRQAVTRFCSVFTFFVLTLCPQKHGFLGDVERLCVDTRSTVRVASAPFIHFIIVSPKASAVDRACDLVAVSAFSCAIGKLTPTAVLILVKVQTLLIFSCRYQTISTVRRQCSDFILPMLRPNQTRIIVRDACSAAVAKWSEVTGAVDGTVVVSVACVPALLITFSLTGSPPILSLPGKFIHVRPDPFSTTWL